MVYAFLAEGFEVVEALAVVDVLKRAKIDVKTVSVTGCLKVTSSNGTAVFADTLIEDVLFSSAELLFLPGGMPGTLNLASCEPLKVALVRHNDAGRRIAAICAAPSVLGELGMLAGKRATCYPGFESKLLGAEYTHQGVVTDGNITTARGMGFSVELGLELVRLLVGAENASRVKSAIQCP